MHSAIFHRPLSRCILLGTAAAICGLPIPAVASAQVAEPDQPAVKAPNSSPPPKRSAKPEASDESAGAIVVTGRGRSEALQKVPESITTFSAQRLHDARIQSFGDFVAQTPNFDFFPSATPGNFQMSIRGISQAGGNGGDAPVVMVVDGVILPYPNSFTMPLFDIERIEVLKGPQGALYGQNAIGGAVVVTTKQPTDHFEEHFTASYGKDNDYQLTAVASGPLVKDKLLFRIAAMRHHFDGDIRYAYAPRDKANYLNDSYVRGDLKFIPANNFSVDIGVDYNRTFSGTQPLVPVTFSTGSGIPNVSTAYLNSQLVLNEPNQDYHTHTNRKALNASARILWDLGFAEFSSVTAGTRLDENNHQDLDVSNIPFVRLVDQPVRIRAFSEELRLTSPNDQRLRWIVTGFMSKVHRSIPFSIDGNLALLFTGDVNPADAVYVPFVSDNADQHLNSYAIAAQINYDILSTLELTVAGRYDHDPRSQVDQGVHLQRTFNKFQPKATLSWKPTPNQTYYVNYAEGFRPGGFNPGNNPAVQPVFDPEQTKTYEAGAKFRFLDGHAYLSVAGYATRYSNQQLTLVQVSASGASQSIFTVKRDQIKGLEFEGQATPMKGLNLNAGLGIQDGKIKAFGNSLNGSAFDPSAYVGKNVPLLSKYTFNASAQYSFPLSGNVNGFIHGDFIRKGRLYWYADNRVSRAPFNLVNAKAGIRTGAWEFDVYGSNIFNKHYYSLYFDNTFVGAPGGFDFAHIGDLSRYGIEASAHF